MQRKLNSSDLPLRGALDKSNNHSQHKYAATGKIDYIKLLLDNKWSFQDKNLDEELPIDLAAKNGHWECVILLASKEPKSSFYNSALNMAVKAKQLKATEALLKAGANPNNYSGSSDPVQPLHIAVLNNDVEMVKLLMQYPGNDPDSLRTVHKGSNHEHDTTPLSIALRKKYWGCLLALLDKNYIAKRKKHGVHLGEFRNLYYYAIDNKLSFLLFALKEAGIPASLTDEMEIHAVKNNQPFALPFLMNNSLFVPKKSDHKTPLQLAIELNHVACITFYQDPIYFNNHLSNTTVILYDLYNAYFDPNQTAFSVTTGKIPVEIFKLILEFAFWDTRNPYYYSAPKETETVSIQKIEIFTSHKNHYFDLKDFKPQWRYMINVQNFLRDFLTSSDAAETLSSSLFAIIKMNVNVSIKAENAYQLIKEYREKHPGEANKLNQYGLLTAPFFTTAIVNTTSAVNSISKQPSGFFSTALNFFTGSKLSTSLSINNNNAL